MPGLKRSILIILLMVITVVLGRIVCAETAQEMEGEMSYRQYLVKEAELPGIPDCPDLSDTSVWDEEMLAQFDAWWEAKEEQQGIFIPDIEQLQAFIRNSTRQLIKGCESSNFLCSPISLWFCLHILSDLTDGSSREQIQKVLGRGPAEDQEVQLDAVFRSLYWEEDSLVCNPAVSVWTDQGTGISKSFLASPQPQKRVASFWLTCYNAQ